MVCTQCGLQLPDEAKFCQRCGVSTDPAVPPVRPAPARPSTSRPLVRPARGKKIAGVCAAFANQFEIDVTLVRVAWLLLVLFAGTGLLAYIVCWIVIPKEEDVAPLSTPPAAAA